MGDINQNQFQLNNNDSENDQRALQRSNVDSKLSVPYGEAPQRHHLSTHTDDSNRWLVTAADEERGRGTGFMLTLKRWWDQRYPQRKHVSKQNLRGNAARFKKEITINDSTEAIQDVQKQGSVEMKINLLRNKPMSAQTLRDNAVRFRRNSSLLNLIEVRDRTDVEPKVRDIIHSDQNRNENIATGNERDSEIQCDMTNGVSTEVDADENQNADVEHGNNRENLETIIDEDDETKSIRFRFMKILHTLTPTTKNIEKRAIDKDQEKISDTEFIRGK